MAEGVLAAGKAAIRRFLRPFLLIQLVAVALVVAYHVDARVRAVCAALAAWKAAGGLPLAAATAAFAGGVLPELAKLAAQRGRASGLRARGGEIAFNMSFFALNGVLVDRLYVVEAALFGTDAHVATVAAKVAFDQLVFTPPWLALVTVLYLWRRRGFSTQATLRSLRAEGFPRFVRGRIVPLLLPDWFFWIPMVTVIYAFPVPLQFLLFILALAAWSLILVMIASGDASADAVESATLDA
ncbi:MAG TPA: hypothetical protein VH560_06910 [Polyangia bacterium]|nr:hypothetical protein [Polyangia bacterium]